MIIHLFDALLVENVSIINKSSTKNTYICTYLRAEMSTLERRFVSFFLSFPLSDAPKREQFLILLLKPIDQFQTVRPECNYILYKVYLLTFY